MGYDSFCCTRPRTSCTPPSPAAPLSCATQRRSHPCCVLVDPTRYEGRQSLPVRRCPSCRAYADSVNRGTHVASTCKIEEAIGFYGRTVQPALHQVGGGCMCHEVVCGRSGLSSRCLTVCSSQGRERCPWSSPSLSHRCCWVVDALCYLSHRIPPPTYVPFGVTPSRPHASSCCVRCTVPRPTKWPGPVA